MRRRGNNIFIIAILLAAALCAACVRETEMDFTPTDNTPSRFNADGVAYVCVNIEQADNDSPTRAVNGVFEDPTTEESNIYNGLFVLFRSTSDQRSATFHSAYDIMVAGTPENEYVEKSMKRVITINRSAEGGDILGDDHLYAVVLLNTNGIFSLTANNGLSVNGTPLTKMSKLTDFSRQVLTTIGSADSGKGFFMSNAPGETTEAAPTGAVEFTHVYLSEQEAIDALATDAPVIHVERAAVRVKVKADSEAEAGNHIAGNKQGTAGASALTFGPKDIAVALDAYNTAFYALRQFNKDWLAYTIDGIQRFSWTSGDGRHLRTYWAEDVNYEDASATYPLQPYNAFAATDFASLGDANLRTFYVAENTMAVDKQQLELTTCLLIRVQLNGGKSFYTINGGDDIYYLTPIPYTEEGTSASSSFAPRRLSAEVATVPTLYTPILEWMKTQAAAESDPTNPTTTYGKLKAWLTKYAIDNAGQPQWEVLVLNADNNGDGFVNVSLSLSQRIYESTTAAALTEFNAILNATDGSGKKAYARLTEDITAEFHIRYYANGYCYYRLPIQHFGDELTPWTYNESTMSSDTQASTYYGTDANANTAYLGRYGLVRNNSYNVNLKTFTHIGEIKIVGQPDYSGVADDAVWDRTTRLFTPPPSP